VEVRSLDFLIIGAQKAGTTSLRAFLESIPAHVKVSKTEYHFWNREGQYNDGFGLSGYMENFAEASEKQLVGEKSPSYLGSYEAPARIHKHFPNVKLIAILRNPAERAYSAYWHGRRVGAIDPKISFLQSIQNHRKNHGKPYGDLVTPGLYSQHLARYHEFFPKDQILVLDFQQLLAEPTEELTKSISFLGLDLETVSRSGTLEFPKRNVARVSRLPAVSRYIHGTRLLSYETKSKILKKFLKTGDIPPMEPEDRLFLSQIYRDEAEKVSAITGRKFNWDY
jgi:hypothetical protein